SSTSARANSPSLPPRAHAAPALVEARALNPSFSRRRIPPISQGLGNLKQPSWCRARKAARLSPTLAGILLCPFIPSLVSVPVTEEVRSCRRKALIDPQRVSFQDAL